MIINKFCQPHLKIFNSLFNFTSYSQELEVGLAAAGYFVGCIAIVASSLWPGLDYEATAECSHLFIDWPHNHFNFVSGIINQRYSEIAFTISFD